MSPLRCATLFYNRGHRRGLGGFGETFYPHDKYRFRTKGGDFGKKKGVGSRVVVLDQSPAVAGKAQVIFGDLVCWFMNGLFRAMSNSEFVLRSLVKFRKAFHEPEMHPCSYLKSKPRMQSEFPFALCLGWGETRPHHNEDEEHEEEEEEEEEEDGVWR